MTDTCPSPELAAITRRWVATLSAPDRAAMVNLLSDGKALVFCGTAENEVREGERMRRSYAAHLAEIPMCTFWGETVHAFESGPTGWAFWEGMMQAGGNVAPVRTRITLVFGLESGIWKVQHIHNSFAVSNLESLGYEHTALEDLIAAAQGADPLIGHGGSATVMFTDIADSSALAEVLGDTRWTGIVQSHVAMIAEALAAQDGRLVKSLGDGTMSTFASAGGAMRCAQAIQRHLADDPTEPRLQVRIGLHTGDVVQAGDDFFGTVVNKAARIAGAARPGEIRVSESTRIMVGGGRDYRFTDPATVPLKGLEGEHLIHRLEWGE